MHTFGSRSGFLEGLGLEGHNQRRGMHRQWPAAVG